MTCLRGIILLLACLVPMGASADSDREPTLPDCREAAADPTIKLYVGGPAVKFALACYFTSTGGARSAAPQVTVNPAGDDVVMATVTLNAVEGDSLVLTPSQTMTGETSVTVTRGSESKVFHVEVLPNCVALADPIPRDTLVMGGAAETVDVGPHFLRDRGRALEFSATSSALVDVTVSGSALTLDPGPSPGTATVTVTAKNNCGMMASDFDVLVETPVVKVKKALPDTTVARNDTLYIHLADHFRDPDGDRITYWLYLEYRGEDYVGVTTVGAMRDSLRIIGKQVHPASDTDGSELEIEAQDGEGSAWDEMDIRVVTSINGSPEIKQAIADRTLASGGYTAEYTLSDHFEDPDGDVLTYSLPSPPSIATGNISGGTLTVTTGAATGTAAFTVRAEDPDGAYVEEVFDVTVTQNQAPAVDVPIGDRTVPSGGAPIEIRLKSHFSDPDGDDDALSYTVERLSQSGVVTATIADNETERSTLTVTPETVANRSTVDITIRASDPGGLYAENTFTVTVSVECVITVHSAIADTTLASNGYTAEYLLADHFSASSLCTSALTYTTESDRPDVATVAIANNGMPGSKLTVTSRGTTQTAEITVTATSGTVSEPDDFEVEVTENEAPELIPIADVELELGGNPHPIPLANHFTDPDGKPEDLTYTWSSSNASLLTIGRSGGALVLTPGTATGSTTITLGATDPGELYVEDDFTVTVSCGITLDAPMADVSLISGGNTHKIDLTDHFSSTCPSVDYTPNSSHPGVATVTESADELTVTSGSSTGTAEITVEATATGASPVSGDFEVRVTDACETTTTAIGDFSLPSDGHKVTIDLANHFSSNCTLQFVASSDDNAKATVSESSGELTVTSNDMGQATITVRATEPGGTYVETEFDVDVDENEAPEVERAIPDQQLESGGSPVDFELDYHFEDPDWDDDLLHYSVHSPNPGVASARIRYNETPDSELIVTPGTVSQETDVEISVTARDPGGLTVTERFDVTVGCTITLDAPIGDVTLSGAGTTHQIPLSSHFSSNHCPTIGYTADSDDPNVATVSESGGTLTVTTVGAGTAEISVTASATGAASVTEEFDVMVTGSCTITLDRALPDKSLPSDGHTHEVDLTRHFSSTCQDIDYMPESDNTSVVTVSELNDELTLTSDDAGRARISVTASAPGATPQTGNFNVDVDENEAPEVERAIPDQQLESGGSPVDFELDYHFEDPDWDDDQLHYSVHSPNPGVASARITDNETPDSELIVTPGTVSRETDVEISVTARDPGGLAVTERFDVTVGCTITLDAPIGDVALSGAGTTRQIPLSSHFSSNHCPTIGYSADSDDPNVATVSESGGTLTVTTVGAGTAEISVTASATGAASVTEEFDVTVTIVVDNPPEVTTPIPDQTLKAGGAAAPPIHLDNHFTDEDANLNYSHSIATGGNSDLRAQDIVTGSINNTTNVLTLTPGGTAGTVTVTVTATDSKNQSTDDPFTVTVNANAPPNLHTDFDARSLDTDASDDITLSDHFEDPDGNDDQLRYTASSNRPGVATASIANNGTANSELTVTATGGGLATISVTATDPEGAETTERFTATVNYEPVCSATHEVPLTIRSDDATRSMSSFCSDADRDNLTYSVAALGPNPPATVTVSPSGAVRIVPRAVGTVTATVTADDGNGGRATQLIEVTVSNLPPETEDTFENIDLLPTDSDKDYDLDDYFSDPENEALTYRASSDPTGVVSTTASGSTLTLSNYVVGETTVEATAEDPHGASEEQEFTVRVCGKPTATAIPDYTFVRGDAAETEDLEDHFSNPNSGTFTYGVTADPPSLLGLSIDANNVLTISPGNTARSTSGPTTVEVTVTGTSDCRNQEAETSFTVTLRSPPFVTNAIGTQSLQVNGNAQTLDLSQHFNETDGDQVSYSARLVTTLQRIPDYVSLDVTGSILTMTPGTTAGSISVEVTATDPDGSASQTFTLIVTGGS